MKWITYPILFFLLIHPDTVLSQSLVQLDQWTLERNPSLIGFAPEDLSIRFGYHHHASRFIIPVNTLQMQILSGMGMQNAGDGFSIGALMRFQEAGINRLQKAVVNPALAFHKSLSDLHWSRISMALMGGIIKTQFDEETLPQFSIFKMVPLNASYLSGLPVMKQSGACFDISMGIAWEQELSKHTKISIGAALLHFNQYIRNFSGIEPIHWPKREWVLNAGIHLLADDQQKLEFFSDLRYTSTNLIVNTALLWMNPFKQDSEETKTDWGLGLYYSNNGFLAPSLQVSQAGWGIFLNYQCNTLPSQGLKAWKNSLEGGISAKLDCHRRKRESLNLKCPR